MNTATVQSAGLLVLRLVVGVTFLLHGLDKAGDLSGTEQFFTSLGIPAPELMAPFVAATETVGGVLLLGGASLALALTGAGRFSVDAALALPRRLRERASATSWRRGVFAGR